MSVKNYIKVGSVAVGGVMFILLVAQNPILTILLAVSAGAYFYAEKFVQ